MVTWNDFGAKKVQLFISYLLVKGSHLNCKWERVAHVCIP